METGLVTLHADGTVVASNNDGRWESLGGNRYRISWRNAGLSIDVSRMWAKIDRPIRAILAKPCREEFLKRGLFNSSRGDEIGAFLPPHRWSIERRFHVST